MDGHRTEDHRMESERAFGGKLIDQDDAAPTRTRPFHASVAASSVPIVVIDADATVRLWNRAAERIFGCSREQVIDGSIPIIPFEQRDTLPASDTPGIHAIVRTPVGDRRTTSAGDRGTGRLLQALTDACRLIAGADFSAASFHVAGEGGGHYLLHALSGTTQKGPDPVVMPRNTIGFAPLSAGDANVRSGVTQRWYDRNLPHQRVWIEMETVDSFLALPILADSGEVRGGLFLGHPDPDVFTPESQRVVVALAESAGVAIDNARLYEAEHRAHIAHEDRERSPSLPLADGANSGSTETTAGARAAFRLVSAKRRVHVPQENNETAQVEATPSGEERIPTGAGAHVARSAGHIRRNSEGRPQPGKIDR